MRRSGTKVLFKVGGDGRRGSERTVDFRERRMIVVGNYFWKRKKQKEKVKQVLKQRFIFKAILKWMHIPSWHGQPWGRTQYLTRTLPAIGSHSRSFSVTALFHPADSVLPSMLTQLLSEKRYG